MITYIQRLQLKSTQEGIWKTLLDISSFQECEVCNTTLPPHLWRVKQSNTKTTCFFPHQQLKRAKKV